MDSQLWVVIAAIVVALLMAIKPEMFIPNPDHRGFRMVRGIKRIGTSVAIVLLLWLALTLLYHC